MFQVHNVSERDLCCMEIDYDDHEVGQVIPWWLVNEEVKESGGE